MAHIEMKISNPDGVRPHLTLRPLWICRNCGAPWPCGSAKLALTSEYADSRAALCIHLAGVLHAATVDLYTLNPHDAPDLRILFDRFVGWVRLHRPDLFP